MDNEHIEQLRQVIQRIVVEHVYYDHDDGRIWGDGAAVGHILAATYPPACHTCKGQSLDEYLAPDDCLDCPTIAQLLAWGVAVATAEHEPERNEPVVWGWNDRLDALKAVKP